MPRNLAHLCFVSLISPNALSSRRPCVHSRALYTSSRAAHVRCQAPGTAEGSCISARSFDATASQEGLAADGADDDVLKQPALRVPFDGANGAAHEGAEDDASGAVHDDGGAEAESGSGRLAPATPDLDEELQQSAAATAAGTG